MKSEDEVALLFENALERQREEHRLREFDGPHPALTELIGSSADARITGGSELLLQDRDPERRILGARVLTETRGDRSAASQAVADRLAVEEDPAVLPWLVSALSWLGHRGSIPRLLDLTTHPDPSVRYDVAGALSLSAWPDPPTEAVQGLVQMANDEHHDVRYSAVYELAQWWSWGNRDPMVRDTLRRAFARDPDPRIGVVLEEAGFVG